MLVGVDPEGCEAKELMSLVDLRNANVLEIGCGDGRLTSYYAPIARGIIGVDHEHVALSRARRTQNNGGSLGRASFVRASAPCLPFASGSIDVVIFARSL
jgi:ubiquinone/menaquinone biosynthesis C-methylase UbiE